MLDLAVCNPGEDLVDLAEIPLGDRKEVIAVVEDDSPAAALRGIETPDPAAKRNFPFLSRCSLDALDAYRERLANGARVEQLLRLDHRWVVLKILKDPKDFVRSFRGFDHLVALGDVHGHGLLHGDVFAGLQCGNALLAVQVMGSDDLHGVDLGVRKQLVIVGEGATDAPLLAA